MQIASAYTSHGFISAQIFIAIIYTGWATEVISLSFSQIPKCCCDSFYALRFTNFFFFVFISVLFDVMNDDDCMATQEHNKSGASTWNLFINFPSRYCHSEERENRKYKNLIHFGLTMLAFEILNVDGIRWQNKFFHSMSFHSLRTSHTHRGVRNVMTFHSVIHFYFILIEFIHSESSTFTISKFGRTLWLCSTCHDGHLILAHFGSRCTSCRTFKFFPFS